MITSASLGIASAAGAQSDVARRLIRTLAGRPQLCRSVR